MVYWSVADEIESNLPNERHASRELGLVAFLMMYCPPVGKMDEPHQNIQFAVTTKCGHIFHTHKRKNKFFVICTSHCNRLSS
jgi:hypothetical protein